MKIYLDIDDTLLYTDIFNTRPANYLKEFLYHVVSTHDVYWLTTHCNGDASVPVLYLSRFVPEDLIPVLMRIRPTKWDISKTEGIDINSQFLWFDDTLLPSEEKVLNSNNKMASYIKVDLDSDPDIFKNFLSI